MSTRNTPMTLEETQSLRILALETRLEKITKNLAGDSDESTKAMLLDRYGPKVRPIAYICHLPRITALAREYGYAIAVHGSLQRDFDLIAVPWSAVAVTDEELVDEHSSEWFCGEWGFVLADQRPLQFLPCKGALGFFPADYYWDEARQK